MKRQRTIVACLLCVVTVSLFVAKTASAEVTLNDENGATVYCPPNRNGNFENPPRSFYVECLDEEVVIGGGFVMEWCILTPPSGHDIHKMRYHLNTVNENPPYYVIRDSGGPNETTYYAVRNRMNFHRFSGPMNMVHYNEHAFVESDSGERLRIQFTVTPDGIRHGSCPIELVEKPREQTPTWSVVKSLFR